MTSSQLAENLSIVKQNVLNACVKSQRDPKSVKILLATKTVPSETVLHAFQLGYKMMGENKVQELKPKQAALANSPIEWHFIGHLQSNKAKDVIDNCALIHSVDRLSLAQEIDRRANSLLHPVNILIEVNTSNEQSKSGLPPNQVIGFCKALASFKNIRVKGLMTMAMPSENKEDVRQCFRTLKNIFEEIKKLNLENVEMNELSMGMSQDYEMAIEEGATIIRLGSVVFGVRA